MLSERGEFWSGSIISEPVNVILTDSVREKLHTDGSIASPFRNSENQIATSSLQLFQR
jgi:hypothetical protein